MKLTISMKKLIITFIGLLSGSVFAAGGVLTLPNDSLPKLNGDALIISQQRGMQVYMNNCMGCHALSFQRYKRTAEDLKIPEATMLENFVPAAQKIGDLMTNNMNKKAAAEWFGAAPPDLSVVSRARGTDWLYNYFRAFYQDDSRPYGVNNSVFKDVGMPHVLELMQGMQGKTEKVQVLEDKIAAAQGDMAAAKKKLEDGDTSSDVKDAIQQAETLIHDSEAELTALAQSGEFFKIIKQGWLTPAEFDQAMADLVNFLDYIGEPIKQKRKSLGIFVLLFISIFGMFAYWLKKEYWKDIH